MHPFIVRSFHKRQLSQLLISQLCMECRQSVLHRIEPISLDSLVILLNDLPTLFSGLVPVVTKSIHFSTLLVLNDLIQGGDQRLTLAAQKEVLCFRDIILRPVIGRLSKIRLANSLQGTAPRRLIKWFLGQGLDVLWGGFCAPVMDSSGRAISRTEWEGLGGLSMW